MKRRIFKVDLYQDYSENKICQVSILNIKYFIKEIHLTEVL